MLAYRARIPGRAQPGVASDDGSYTDVGGCGCGGGADGD